MFIDSGVGVGSVDFDGDIAVDDEFMFCFIRYFSTDDVFFDIAVHPGGDVAFDEFRREVAGAGGGFYGDEFGWNIVECGEVFLPPVGGFEEDGFGTEVLGDFLGF